MMSGENMRRKIEALRAQMDAVAAERNQKAVGDEPVADGRKKGGINESIDDRMPSDEGQCASGSGLGAVTDRIVSSHVSGVIMQWTVVLALTIALLVAGRGFLVPLAVALLLWNILNAFAGVFGRIQIGSSPLPGWIAWTLAVIALFLVNALVYWILTSQSAALNAAAPVYQANFSKLVATFTTLIGIERMPSTAQFMETLNLGALLSWLGGSVGAMLTETVVVAIYVAFLLFEQRHFSEKIVRLAPNEDSAAKTRVLLRTISKQIQTYMWIKTVASLLTGLISYVVLRLVGVDFAAVWALIIFLLNYIPTVGSAIGVIFPSLLTLVQFEPLMPFVLTVIGLSATQFVIGNVVEPAMMGSSLNLSPLAIILSLSFWGMIWGIAGMVLCVPIMVIIAIVCSHFKRFNGVAVLLSADGRISVPQAEL